MDSSRDLVGIDVPKSAVHKHSQEESRDERHNDCSGYRKGVFEIALSHEPGVVNEKHRVTRKKLLSFFANQPPATVVMEACGSAHHWAREVN